ncbi:rCG62984 [Rattus norvegicus]|uniref:RCG62984 n=1 Tax=Rattus norvegicus TaxID=10116 RepID=A6HLZ3_RAT|nr:rCG62984 [Rattus norvegicus]
MVMTVMMRMVMTVMMRMVMTVMMTMVMTVMMRMVMKTKMALDTRNIWKKESQQPAGKSNQENPSHKPSAFQEGKDTAEDSEDVTTEQPLGKGRSNKGAIRTR